MISAKEAVKIAFSYMKEFFPKERELELEEIELDDNRKDWSITISFPDKRTTSGIAAFTHSITSAPRKYKSILVNLENGNVDAMKIRKLA